MVNYLLVFLYNIGSQETAKSFANNTNRLFTLPIKINSFYNI